MGRQYGHYPTMRELVIAFNSEFKFPYKNTTNDAIEKQRRKIATELYETGISPLLLFVTYK